METAIHVEGISKRYRVGENRSYRTLRESVGALLQLPLKGVKGRSERSSAGTFLALNDVSFDVEEGEALAVIGPNGSGKSTLLKVLSRITVPTAGSADIHGRVGSLLEVGTGFHPELTGRENVYLNGAILGMKRWEINQKFDDIVEFSGVSQHIDTPVKHYSSGMYLRLGFAVAAHLEPEILIVDEVLAVGDAEFQRRCLGKMQDVARSGRTVLFVSHNMGAVTRLCDRAILLEHGVVTSQGNASSVVADYLGKFAGLSTVFSRENDETSPVSLLEASIVGEDELVDVLARQDDIRIRLKYCVNREVSSAHVYVNVLLSDGTVAFGTGDADVHPNRFGTRKPGTYVTEFTIPGMLLNEGYYLVSVSMGIPFQRNFQENNGILAFSLVDVVRDSRQVHQRRAGLMRLDLPWRYPCGNPFETSDCEGQG